VTLRMWARLGLIAFGAVIIQVGLLDQIVIAQAHADLFLLLAISAGLVAGPQQGAAIAFTFGLVADLFVQTPFGLSSLCYVLVAFAAGLATTALPGRATFGFQVAAAFLGGVGGTLLFDGLGVLLGQPTVPFHELAVVAIIVSAACMAFIYPACRLFDWTVAVGPGTHRDAGAFASGSAR
jgi:rod shape-determining protein MreD